MEFSPFLTGICMETEVQTLGTLSIFRRDALPKSSSSLLSRFLSPIWVWESVSEDVIWETSGMMSKPTPLSMMEISIWCRSVSNTWIMRRPFPFFGSRPWVRAFSTKGCMQKQGIRHCIKCSGICI